MTIFPGNVEINPHYADAKTSITVLNKNTATIINTEATIRIGIVMTPIVKTKTLDKPVLLEGNKFFLIKSKMFVVSFNIGF